MLPWSLEHRVFAYDAYVKNGESMIGPSIITRLCWETCTLGELKTAIRENIQEIGEETLVKVEANFRKRLQICACEYGHHLPDIIFRSLIFHNGIV